MEQSLEEKQYIRMTQAPVKPLILKLAVPTIISMLITSLYNLGDTFFVAQLGTSASGAVGVVFSLMAIIQAIGFTLGMGSGSIISRALGRRDHQSANRTASTAFFAAIGLGALLTLFGSLFIKDLMRGLGATATVLPYAQSYASYILFGAPLMTAGFVLNNLLRAEGKAKFAMVGLASGAILNLLLDPLFIFVLDMGIAGAAIATIISQALSTSLLLGAFLLHKSVLVIRPRLVTRHIKDLFEIIRTGFPSLCRQGLASISTILLNVQAAEFGDAALSALSIVSKIFMLLFCIGLGIGQGYQPVVGYNYGAKKWGRMREAFLFTFATGTVFMTVAAVATYLAAPRLIPLFIADPDVIAIGTKALRFQALSMPLLSTNVICNMTFQSLGQNLKATLLSCCRQGFFFIPLILTLPPLMGITGLESVQMFSDCLTFLVSLPFVLSFLKRIPFL